MEKVEKNSAVEKVEKPAAEICKKCKYKPYDKKKYVCKTCVIRSYYG